MAGDIATAVAMTTDSTFLAPILVPTFCPPTGFAPTCFASTCLEPKCHFTASPSDGLAAVTGAASLGPCRSCPRFCPIGRATLAAAAQLVQLPCAASVSSGVRPSGSDSIAQRGFGAMVSDPEGLTPDTVDTVRSPRLRPVRGRPREVWYDPPAACSKHRP